MCRFLAYSGDPIFLEELICKPEHSLVRQSMRADEAKVTTNGDGFGIGWYTGIEGRTEPGVYREVTPAWSDENLLALCAAVRSPLFFAHVRATTGTSVARQNCHPFRYEKYLFIHNGQIGGYEKVRRQLEAALPDDLYALRKGATDSELMFLLTIALVNSELHPLVAIETMLAQVSRAVAQKGIAAPVRFAAALSDGERIYAVRYSTDERPPSLYVNRCESGTVIASEPLQDRTCPKCPEWVAVKPNMAVIIEGDRIDYRELNVARERELQAA